MSSPDPLIQALPPATDYLTYLTLIEYNLTVDKLGVLHHVLQDETLTTNIGWDLVHLLAPLLPASTQCLEDVARLGNPREVILKVTECLRFIETSAPESDSGRSETKELSSSPPSPPPPLSVSQFTVYLSMLSILHSRIKTRQPSRFLSTTLQAILAAFVRFDTHQEELTLSIVKFIRTVLKTKRPQLPPRKSSTQIPLASHDVTAAADDPEGDADADETPAGEVEIQTRLVQSFLTHVVESYVLSCNDDAPGLAWCDRVYEKMHPERLVPGKPSMIKRFEVEDNLRARLTAVGELLAISLDIGLDAPSLAAAMLQPEVTRSSDDDDDEEPPKRADDIPLARLGSLFLYVAQQVSTILYRGPQKPPDMHIFPEHQAILSAFLSSEAGLGSTAGSEPEPVCDSLLALGLILVEADKVGQPVDAECFNQYLQHTSLIAANSPEPNLRHHAFYLTTTVLRSNPSDVERLAFVRDTLEHCPLDNLRASAISWIRGETLDANPFDSPQTPDHDSLYSTPVALETLGPFLFPDLTDELASPDVQAEWTTFAQRLSFYLGSLNFYLLLLSAPQLRDRLAIGRLHTTQDVAGSFLQPLRTAVETFKKPENKPDPEWQGQLDLLDVTLQRVTRAVAALNG